MARYSSKSIMKEFGLTRKEFRSQYEVFRRKVSNFNRVTGTNYSAIDEFRYSLKFPKNATIQSIQSTSSALGSVSKRTLSAGETYIKNRYSGLINSSPILQQKVNQIGKNGYTVKDFDRDARQVAENLRTARSKNPYVASDEIIDDEPLNSMLVSENNQIIERDELYD